MAATFIISVPLQGMESFQHPVTGKMHLGIQGVVWSQPLPEQITLWQDHKWFSLERVQVITRQLMQGLEKMELSLAPSVKAELVRALMANMDINDEGYYPSRNYLGPKFVVIEDEGHQYTLSNQQSEMYRAFKFVNTKLNELIGSRQRELEAEKQKRRLEEIQRESIAIEQRVFERIKDQPHFLAAYDASRTSEQTLEDYWRECNAFILISDEEEFVEAVKAGKQKLM